MFSVNKSTGYRRYHYMHVLMCSFGLTVVCSESVTYKNQYIVKINDQNLASVKDDLTKLELTLHGKILSSIYLFDLKSGTNSSNKPDINFLRRLKACCQGQIEDAEQVVERTVSLWLSPDDYRKLEENAEDTITFPANYSAWSSEQTGRGVAIGVSNVGVDINLPFLLPSNSIDVEHAVHLLQGTRNSSREQQSANAFNVTDFQNCALVVTAAGKEHCGTDIIYQSKIAGLKLLELKKTYRYLGDTNNVLSVDESYEIFCTNWNAKKGVDAYQVTVSSLKALSYGIKHGRGGKGSIFVFPVAGIGDEYTNNMYTVTVNGVNGKGTDLYHTRLCACVLVTAVEEVAVIHRDSEKKNQGIQNSTCSRDFMGSSGTAAVVAGVIGLALQVNAQLTWRDVQHLLVESTANEQRFDSSFRRNGAGKRYSYKLGFGFVNASKMITLAKTWKSVPDQICHTINMNTTIEGITYSCNEEHAIPRICTASFALPADTGIATIEHVTSTVSYTTPNEYSTDLTLESPRQTNSVLLHIEQSDITNVTTRHNVSLLSVHFWGEHVNGSWILTMRCFANGRSSVQLAVTDAFLKICGSGYHSSGTTESSDVTGGYHWWILLGTLGGGVAVVVISIFICFIVRRRWRRCVSRVTGVIFGCVFGRKRGQKYTRQHNEANKNTDDRADDTA